jgi:hypothetical protein
MLQAHDLTLLDDEPRILDLRVAEALDFDRPRNIRKLIERNTEELERHGTLLHHGAKSTGGRPSAEYWLNRNQAICICMKSDAPRAAEVRVEIIAVFAAWLDGRLLPSTSVPITAETIGSIFEMKLIPVRHDIQQLDTKVARIDANVVFLNNRVDDIVPNRAFSVACTRQWKTVILKYYNGECPSCRKITIVDDAGSSIDGVWNDDHFEGRELNRVANGWGVCCGCNQKMKNDPLFKISRRQHFQVFHDYRVVLFGRDRLPREAVDQMELSLQ